MKRVFGVSLGSSKRDFERTINLGGDSFELTRRGTDGRLGLAEQIIREMDGRVDAICLGGVNLAYTLGDRRYPCPDGSRLAKAARRTPVLDGQAFKETYEPQVPGFLEEAGHKLEGKRVLVVSVLDRWPLADALYRKGARVLVGDAAFALSLPVFFPSLRAFSIVARCCLPFLSRLPVEALYPLGERQEVRRPRFAWLWENIDVIAGDFHFIRRYMPPKLDGQWVLTSTTTAEDRAMLRQAGIGGLVTMVPPICGRTPGANMLDGMAAALEGTWPISPERIRSIWDRFGLRPRIERF